MIRVIVAEDHAVVRAGLARLIEDAGDMTVVSQVPDGDGVRRVCEETEADVLLLDVSMPGPGFLAVLRAVREAAPSLRVLVLSAHAEEQYAVRALREGAAGYLTKGRDADELMHAIRRVSGGRRYVSDALAEHLARRVAGEVTTPDHTNLSSREYDVLSRLGAGRSLKEIAAELDVSPKTVSTYRSRLLGKLGFATTADLIRYAVQHDLRP